MTFSRQEVLGGMPARRAGTLVFAIETRTAQLVARDRRAMATYVTERAEADRERAFLDALAAGRGVHDRVSIQDIERHAERWAELVPADAETRAAIIARLTERHRLRAADIPAVRRVLGLDDPAVSAAYHRQTGREIATAYTERLPIVERWRWLRSRAARRLESLPPFWMAFSLTLTETVGAGVLALPIAFAVVGPIGAVIILVAFGLVNTLTIAALVEAITRDGTMRYGSSYFGRFVGAYLGRPGSLSVSLAMVLLNAIGLVALMLGFSLALEGVTGLPSGIWAAGLAGAILLILRRESLDATVASVLAVGSVNIAIVIAISLIALANVDPANLTPTTNAGSGASLAGLVFGTALMAFFGHTSAGNAAKVVLRRDPSGTALLRGNVAAMAVSIVLYTVFVFAALAAVPAAAYVGFPGTALGPLVAETGPLVALLGGVFVVLALGLSSLHIGLGLYNQVGEWIPPGRISGSARVVVRVLPIVGLLAVLEVVLFAGAGSFTDSMSFLGTITVPLLGGVFPMLILVATRRRGEYVPGVVPREIGHPLVVVAVSALYVVGLLAHGLIIWTDPLPRAAAIGAAVITMLVVALALRDRAFRRRTVVELRVDGDRGDTASLGAVSDGRPLAVDATWRTAAAESHARSASVELGPARSLTDVAVDLGSISEGGDLRVWAHRVDPDGTSEAWPATLELTDGAADTPVAFGDDGVVDVATDPWPTALRLAATRQGR